MTKRLLSSVIVAICAIGVLAQAPKTAPPAAPLPLDPLTPEEVTAAQHIATQDQRVHAIAGDNPRVVVTLFIAPKRGDQTEPAGRFADIVLHNDQEGGGARALVSLSTSSVVDVIRLTERNVPIGQGDIEIAAGLALESAGIQRLLGGQEAARTFHVARGPANRQTMNENRIEGVSDRGVDPDDPCTTHRCVALFFRSQNRYVLANQIVDLTTRRVYVTERARP
jgi:hypothetical protein